LENVIELYFLSGYLQHQKKLVGMTVKQQKKQERQYYKSRDVHVKLFAIY